MSKKAYRMSHVVLFLVSDKPDTGFLPGLYLTIYSSQSHDFGRFSKVLPATTTYQIFPFLERLQKCSHCILVLWKQTAISKKAVMKPSASDQGCAAFIRSLKSSRAVLLLSEVMYPNCIQACNLQKPTLQAPSGNFASDVFTLHNCI